MNVSILPTVGEPACFLYQVHDLTAQRVAATQLAQLADERFRREASENAEHIRSELLSRVSHEMRTPLNAVIGFSQLLQLQHESGESTSRRYADHIYNAGQHLLSLVDDALSFQRASDGTLSLQVARVDLDTFLSATIGLLEPSATTREIRLLPAAASGLAVRADPTRLRQIILNLGSNAIKYNVQGGSVGFEIRPVASSQIEIDIRDSGIGRSADQLEHLYEPFNRLGREVLSVPGVGLGIVITRKLVERMAGTMVVRSDADVGTCVTISLPRVD